MSSGNGGDAESVARNKELSKQLKSDANAYKSEIRLLLLGAGESGKSTIAKQMKIIHMNGFTDEELESYKALIHQNAFSGAKVLSQQVCLTSRSSATLHCVLAGFNKRSSQISALGVKVGKKARSVSKKILDDEDYFAGELTPAQGKDLEALWEDAGVQKVYERRSEYQLSDSVPYYLGAYRTKRCILSSRPHYQHLTRFSFTSDNITRISAETFVPTEQDVLRSRAKTTGIIETDFTVDGTKFKMVDVGGQRSERKKWMHCFQDVTAVLFCVALSEYDLKLEEDGETNRMHESINLFNVRLPFTLFASGTPDITPHLSPFSKSPIASGSRTHQ
jgi:GTPase SAR1 family protein